MKVTDRFLLKVAFGSLLAFSLSCGEAIADCVALPDGRIIEIEAQTCEAIVAESNEEVRKHAGDVFETWNLKKAYTGALVRDKAGTIWMYPSTESQPCKRFANTGPVKMRAYYTCCDTGRWGKCVFGGNWLGDVHGKPINAFQ